ncbi:MAG TPA: efflux RND transporter permease subunit, partial [Gemmata sp.]|nr:efflux RND transporter permease subunit [Gemmata sp.]
MIRQIIGWSLNNPIVVILLACAFATIGVYSFEHVNVEAYPDPAPAIVEVYALFPGASAEEVERQVTIPLEVTFAGMPGLRFIHSKSLFGLSDLKMNWNYGSQWTYEVARQEVINRIATIQQPLPPGVSPTISPESPTGEIYRYILTSPKDAGGHPIYTLNDIKAMEDYTMEREFRTVPRIVDLTSFGGTIRRYEVQPDPDRLRRYGITLMQLQNALANSNFTVGGDYVNQGQVAMTVRSVGLFGGGMDPVNKVLGLPDPNPAATAELTDNLAKAEKEATELYEELERRQSSTFFKMLHVNRFPKMETDKLSSEMVRAFKEASELREEQRRRVATPAAKILRAEEFRRIRDIRSLVIASVNNQPWRVEDVVEGGRVSPGQIGEEGVVVSHQTRLGRIGYWKADRERPSGSPLTLTDVGHDEDDKVQCIVLLRKNEDTLPALKDVKAKVKELNDPASGRMLPG